MKKFLVVLLIVLVGFGALVTVNGARSAEAPVTLPAEEIQGTAARRRGRDARSGGARPERDPRRARAHPRAGLRRHPRPQRRGREGHDPGGRERQLEAVL